MDIRFEALDSDWVGAVRGGAPDAYGMVAERAVSDGDGNPCRHCLRDVPAGRDMLILAARPFPVAQPYAETGPIFLCAEDCARWSGPGVPPVLGSSPDYIARGYGVDDRIVYGTGGVVPAAALVARCTDLLADGRIAYVHIRSARNNCYQARAVRDL